MDFTEDTGFYPMQYSVKQSFFDSLGIKSEGLILPSYFSQRFPAFTITMPGLKGLIS